jgi:hypothetical protein
MRMPRLPKMKSPERKANRTSCTILDKGIDKGTDSDTAQIDIVREKNNAQARMTRNPCLRVSGSSPLYGKRIRRINL